MTHKKVLSVSVLDQSGSKTMKAIVAVRWGQCPLLVMLLIGFISPMILCPSPASADVFLVGSVSVPGDTPDLSGLEGSIGKGTPHNLFGAIGGLEHLEGNNYLALPDRGPLDGDSQFQCRFHQIELTVTPGKSPTAGFRLLQTSMLKTEKGLPLVGALQAFDVKTPSRSLRFDPEGARVSSAGSVFISDEYGPFLYEFDLEGSRKRVFPTPKEFVIAHPSADPKQEDELNSTGRSANGGWEGIALTPDERRLVLAMQKSLLQDRDVVEGNRMRSPVVRLFEVDLYSDSRRQFVYRLDDDKNGISELLAVSNDEFLILERDGLGGVDAKTKRIYRIMIKGATDVSAYKSLSGDNLARNIVPVQKSLLIDLLDSRWGFAGPQCPEKWEGLAFGPTLPDGRRLLWVAVDNDYVPEAPTSFHAFAIDSADLPNFQWKK